MSNDEDAAAAPVLLDYARISFLPLADLGTK